MGTFFLLPSSLMAINFFYKRIFNLWKWMKSPGALSEFQGRPNL